ncbi:penicillin-binding protein 1A [bacterium BMS3Abin05]|nr:penicillin-binding protein 1A [bacterium BMS3Abin05]GBE26860.1 penicillin-binding protein 1A [bacterium BMS3Bbin03]HDZ10590.1 PBP1A family penicillin-binding protein [Bacteroidota bacterium]
MRRRLRSEENHKKSPSFDFNSLLKNRARLIGGSIGIVLLALLIWYTIYIFQGLPSLTELEHYEPKLATKIYSANNVVIKELYTQKREIVPLKDIPDHMKKALIDTEDRRFWNHWGFDLKRTIKAAFIDVVHMSKSQGASTITQQLARELYLTKKKKLTRKIRELITAVQIERHYSKPEILEMYLNHVYYGHGAYGIKGAAEYYFNKKVQDLTVDESAVLVGLLRSPARYSPIRHYDRSIRRRNTVLYMMLSNGDLTKEAYDKDIKKPIILAQGGRQTDKDIAPYFTEWIRQKLEAVYGMSLYTNGYKIYTTLDTRVQAAAENAVHQQLPKLQARVLRNILLHKKEKEILSKYIGDPDSLKAVLKNKALRDSLLNKYVAVQVALIAIEPDNGHILAMIGGRDFKESKFNRAIQAKRQPGSAFKPFIYTAVIDNGYPPTYEVLNQPVVLFMRDGTRWIPHNYDHSQGGPTTLREALRRSLNLVSARLLQELVKPSVVVEYAHRMGIHTPLQAVDALALGTSGVTPIDIASAYSVFPDLGVHVDPIAITKIENRNGEVIQDNAPKRREVLSAATAYIMTTMLQTVINRGTGASARTVYHFMRPAGGKTGTTDNFTDAWFVGFTPQISTAVWVGIDNPAQSLGQGQTGAQAALPIWSKFMKAAHDTLQLPVKGFIMPPGVVRVKICMDSHKLATPYCPRTMEEVFPKNLAPTERCPIHTGRFGNPKQGKHPKKKRVIF